jgi:hypothetical protein
MQFEGTLEERLAFFDATPRDKYRATRAEDAGGVREVLLGRGSVCIVEQCRILEHVTSPRIVVCNDMRGPGLRELLLTAAALSAARTAKQHAIRASSP